MAKQPIPPKNCDAFYKGREVVILWTTKEGKSLIRWANKTPGEVLTIDFSELVFKHRGEGSELPDAS